MRFDMKNHILLPVELIGEHNLTLTLDIELDLHLSAFDVKSIVWRCLAPVQAHHIPTDILQPQATVRCLHNGLSSWH